MQSKFRQSVCTLHYKISPVQKLTFVQTNVKQETLGRSTRRLEQWPRKITGGGENKKSFKE